MRRTLVISLMVAAITFVVFWPARGNGLVKWDDDVYFGHATLQQRISAASVTWAFTTVVPFYYHPLTWLSHLLDYQLWRDDFRGPHIVNVVIHSLNAGLATVLIWLLTGLSSWQERNRLIAAGVTGLIFGIHPLQAESVCWLAERKNLLCGFFALGTVIAYLNYVRNRAWYAAVLILFLLALLSKPMAVPLPVVLLLLDWQPLQRVRRDNLRQLILEKLPLFIMSLACGILTIIGQWHWGAVKDVASFNLAARVLVACRGLFFYFWKLVWPTWFSAYYPLFPEGMDMRLMNPEFLLPLGFLALVTLVALLSLKRFPLLLACWAIYILLLLPTSGLVQVGAQGVADRFAYLAVLAPIGLIACGGALVFERGRFAIRVVLTSGLLVIAAILARQTSRIIPVWRDEETLWRHVLQYYPTASLPHFHIALALVDQRRLAEALPHAEYASQEIPDNALARSTTGLLYLKAGRYAEARRELLAAVTIDPNLWAARYNLACAETGLGNLAKAVKLLQEVLTAQPQYRDFLRRDPALKSLRNDPSSALALQHWLAAP